MLTTGNKPAGPVSAVLRCDLVVDKKFRQKGDVVELSRREFNYLALHEKVAEATQENIAEVKAQLKSEQAAAERAKQPSREDELQKRVKELESQLAVALSPKK